MNTLPLVSVLMPVFNGEAFLAASIESILTQTYSHLELIIVDDGSTDQSLSVVQSFPDARIKFIHQENKGIGAALNVGASIASGEYIAIMDCDDISLPTRFEIQVDFLRANKNISLVSGAFFYIDEQENILGRTFPITMPKAIRKVMMNTGCVIAHPAVMMRKKEFEIIGKYSKEVNGRFPDYHLFMKFLNAGYELANISQPLIKYRLLNNNESSLFTISEEGMHFLVKTFRNNEPSKEAIEKLYAYCVPDKGGLKRRLALPHNFQNKAFSFIKVLGTDLSARLISMVKNQYILIRYFFYKD